MKKVVARYLKRILVFLLFVPQVASCFFGSVQGEDRPDETVVGIIERAKNLSYFSHLIAFAGLEEEFSRKEHYTVFAPTNEALYALDPQLLYLLGEDSERDLLKDIIRYHVVPKRIPKKEIPVGFQISTAQGEYISISKSGIQLKLNQSADIVVTDVAASNGIIHGVNRLLLTDSMKYRINQRIKKHKNKNSLLLSQILSGKINLISFSEHKSDAIKHNSSLLSAHQYSGNFQGFLRFWIKPFGTLPSEVFLKAIEVSNGKTIVTGKACYFSSSVSQIVPRENGCLYLQPLRLSQRGLRNSARVLFEGRHLIWGLAQLGGSQQQL